MTTVCIQCGLEAYIAGKRPGPEMMEAATFNETPEEHQARVHPDLAATKKRRRELEALFAQKHGGTMIYDDPQDNN